METTLEGVNMDSLDTIQEGLESQGYSSTLEDGILTVDVFGVGETAFPVIMTIGNDGDLHITCRITQFGQIGEECLTPVLVEALSQNQTIAPFAYSVITDLDQDGEDEDASEWLLVLTNAIPLSDFSPDELSYHMDKLIDALTDSRQVLEFIG